jgi:serine/threonine-protein kinase
MSGGEDDDAETSPRAASLDDDAMFAHGEEDATAPPHGPASVQRGALVGRDLDGKYRLEALLGAGGMGEVYLAEHLGLGARVAVKTLLGRAANDATSLARFRREARAVARLSHPNVVRVTDFGDDADLGVYFLVMELLEGRSLGSALALSPGPPPIADAAAILGELLAGLAFAHAAGVVHRDLKPDNVFLSEDARGRRVVKIVDFGLAFVDDPREQGPAITREGIIAGTPYYMSPEQCQSLRVGPSTDLYAVGCIMTELLQLAPPFGGGTAMEILAKHMFAPPPPLARPPGYEPVPPLLERLRLDLLQKAAEARPASADEVAARLVEAVDPALAAAKLPGRASDEQGRAARAPAWEAAPRPAAAAPPKGAVALVRLALRDDGVSPMCEVGLAQQGLSVTSARSLDDAKGADAVVLDAGDDLDAAEAALARLVVIAPGAPVLACLARVDTERMNALIAAGAADVARYPVAPDALAKKVARLLRRRR